jgi:hypothetical protein
LTRLIEIEKEALDLLYQNNNFKLVVGHGDLQVDRLRYTLANKEEVLLTNLQTVGVYPIYYDLGVLF